MVHYWGTETSQKLAVELETDWLYQIRVGLKLFSIFLVELQHFICLGLRVYSFLSLFARFLLGSVN